MTGDDFQTIFAKAVGGEHRAKPLGLGDVEQNGCAWSVKTVKGKWSRTRVRLISGRNSPDYSLGIANPREDIAATGRAVLSIWNERVNEALGIFDELRIAVLIRDMAARQFLIFEEEAQRFIPEDYSWRLTSPTKQNPQGNLAGYDRASGVHCFTWQPHGSQFTVVRAVPGSRRRFEIGPNVPLVDPNVVLTYVKYRPGWITIEREGS